MQHQRSGNRDVSWCGLRGIARWSTLVSYSKSLRTRPSELADFLSSCRGAFVGIGLMTAMINVLYLTGSFFMLEIYDRVIPSRSVPTLIGLSIVALALYAFQGALDLI